MKLDGKAHETIINALVKGGLDLSKAITIKATYKTEKVDAGDYYYDEAIPILKIEMKED